jgi:heme/copper-type cytochrome/quinol oxidase subunit 2
MGLLFAQGVVVWFGTRSATAVEFPILGAVLWGLLAGASIGASVAGISHLLSRPDVVGLEELGWESPEEFRAATGRAVGVPVMALLAIAVVVGVFGWLFLAIAPEIVHAGEEVAEGGGSKAPLLIVASVISAAILAVAAFVAYRPTRRG